MTKDFKKLLNQYQGYTDRDYILSLAIALESKRLAEKYSKDVFECEDIQKILNIGHCKSRDILNSKTFPTLKIEGNMKKVSSLALTIWFVDGVLDKND